MAATTSLQKAYAASFIPRISARKTRRLLGSDAIIVDTRITPDYEKGHLEGAINLPVDANDALWRDTVASIPARRPIITYCQSRTCKFAEEVSARLIEDGYSDISIFKGGWAEWVEKYGKPEAHDKEVDGEDEAYDEPI